MRPRPVHLTPLRIGICSAVLFGAVTAAAASATPDSTRVLVKVDPAASSGERIALATALSAVDETRLPAGWRAYDLPHSFSVPDARRALSRVSADLRMELDRPMSISSAIPNDPRITEQWALDAIQAPMAWTAGPAAPVVVAVIDTGVDLGHPDLSSAAWVNPGEVPGNGVDDDQNGYVDDVNGWDFLNGDSTVFDGPEDSHGTHIAGVIAATRDDGVGVAGVAGNARVMALKFVGAGGGSTSDAISALGYARANGARVVNASFGGPYSQALCDAVAEAAAAGTIVIAAAGNDGADIDAAGRVPAMCPEASVLSVAASTSEDGLAGFSNRGAAGVDIAAPGEFILSSVPGAGYETWSGTSMAAPHVAGAAALLMGRNPALAAAQVRQTILETADPAPALAGFVGSGARLDVARALGVTPSATAILTADPAGDDDPEIEAAPTPTVRKKTPARLLRLSVGTSRFRSNQSTRIRYRVDADTRVRFTVRRAGSKAAVSSFVREASAGDNVLLLSGRAGTDRPLDPGVYRVVARTPWGQAPTRAVTIEIIPAEDAGVRPAGQRNV